MTKITKETFIRGLAEAEGISIKQAGLEVNRVLDHILRVVPTLEDGGKLDLTGVVQFEVSDVPARVVRNPQTGEELEKEATRKVVVRPMTALKKAVKA